MAKKALISPLEIAYDYEGNAIGERVAQVVNNGETFPVADPLYWKDCVDDVVADEWYLQTTTNEILPKPQLPEIENV
jgi:hypothetical protein